MTVLSSLKGMTRLGAALAALVLSGCAATQHVASTQEAVPHAGSTAVVVLDSEATTYYQRKIGARPVLVRTNAMGDIRDGLQDVDLQTPLQDLAIALTTNLRAGGVPTVQMNSIESAAAGGFNSVLLLEADKAGAVRTYAGGVQRNTPRAYVRLQARWVDLKSGDTVWADSIDLAAAPQNRSAIGAEVQQLVRAASLQLGAQMAVATAERPSYQDVAMMLAAP